MPYRSIAASFWASPAHLAVVTPNARVVSTGRRWFFGRVVIRIYLDHRSEIRSDPVYKTTFLEYQPLHEFQLAFHQ
jgi:hypothetical protein